jgi:hypothetical protein
MRASCLAGLADACSGTVVTMKKVVARKKWGDDTVCKRLSTKMSSRSNVKPFRVDSMVLCGVVLLLTTTVVLEYYGSRVSLDQSSLVATVDYRR